MTNIPLHPCSPADWQIYANDDRVTSIPLQQSQSSAQNLYIQRDVYLDTELLVTQPAQQLCLYTDIFAFNESNITISPPAFADVRIIARILTANEPVHLRVHTDKNGCQITIYASTLNQPVTVSAGNSEPVILNLGSETGNTGVRLSILPDNITSTYLHKSVSVDDEDLLASLDTQLRIALALFWRNTDIAMSLCSHVARLAADRPIYRQVNIQAGALGQQLAVQAMTGPDMSYAPVLNMATYKSTVNDALSAASAFEEEYKKFQDKKGSVDDQIKIWNTMIEQAGTQREMHIGQRTVAGRRYDDACNVVSRCQVQVETDNRNLNAASEAFVNGLQDWEAHETWLAAIGICKGLIEFAYDINIMSLAEDVDSIADAANALGEIIKEIDHATGIGSGEGIKLASSTVNTLADCMKALEELFSPTKDMVWAVKQLESNPSANIPALGKIYGGDASSQAIIILAAWDRWTIEALEQVEFAVSQGIDGASAYKVALQKQGINGKALAQAQAEAVNAGYEYIQHAMEVVGCEKDIAALQKLRDSFQGEEDLYAEAEARFFQRFLAVRTSLVIEMRKLVWAYKYWALEDSAIDLDSQKSAAEFRDSIFTLDREIESADGKYATGYQGYCFTVPSHRLPANYGPLINDGLQGDDHKASFTLAPTLDPNDPDSLASVFNNGSHFRLSKLEIFLDGVTPRKEAVQDGFGNVDFYIKTSGIYADIQDGKVFHFTSLPLKERVLYKITEGGVLGETSIMPTFDTDNHAEPTPFTLWTIELHNPQDLDLSRLSGVTLRWTGSARY